MAILYDYDPTALTVFISYSWDKTVGRADDVRALAECLKEKKSLNVWIDKNEMDGSTVDRMTQGIDTADVVIVFFSDAYKRSGSCREEATYARQQRKLILPVRMQQNFQLDGWLGFHLGDRLWVEFPHNQQEKGNALDGVLEEVWQQLFRIFDRTNMKKFRTIDLAPFSSRCYSENFSYQPKLEAIKKICRTASGKGGLLVITGQEGVGKTHFMSLLFRQQESQTFLMNECSIGTVLWLNCYPWHDEEEFEEADKTALEGELLKLIGKATKRGLSSGVDFNGHVQILTDILQASPLFVFDDVFHFPLLAFLREYCKSLPCVVITHSKCGPVIEGRQLSLDGDWLQVTVDVVERVDPLNDDVIYGMLRNTFGLKAEEPELRKMAEACHGLPRKAAETAKMYLNRSNALICPNGSISQPNVSKRVLSGTQCTDEEAEIKLIEVPQFDNYYTRPEEEEAVRRGLMCLSRKGPNENGFFVVEGCGGIGKSTLVSHVLRNPENVAFFKRECNVHVIIWLNCYQWRDGFDGNKVEERKFLNELLGLGAKADPEIKDGFKTLKHLLQHFSNRKEHILFVLDDVFHYTILDTLRTESKAVLCCALTRDASKLRRPSFDPFLAIRDQIVENPYLVGYLSDSRVLEIFHTDFRLKGKLSEEQLAELVRRSCGMPLLVKLLGGQFTDCISYELTYKKLLEDTKMGSLEVEKTGRGERTASQLFEVAWNSLSHEDRRRYYAFLLFNPVEPVSERCLQLLWNSETIDEVRHVCRHFERLSLVRHIVRQFKSGDFHYYLIHQILHESAVEVAVNRLIKAKKIGSSKLLLSYLRVRLLFHQNCCEDRVKGNISNMLEGMSRISGHLGQILSRIDNEAFGFLEKVTDPGEWRNFVAPQVLGMAAVNGHVHLVKYLLKIGCHVDAPTDEYGHTALMSASFRGHYEVAQLLIENNAQVEAQNVNGKTALMAASGWGHAKVVELLISKGARINTRDWNEETILMTSAERGHWKVVNLLITHGADVAGSDSKGRTALMKAALRGHGKVVEMLLLETPANQVDAVDHYGETALMKAASGGQCKIVGLLLSRGVDVNASDKDGQTALMKASVLGHDKVVQLLIENAAQVNACDNRGETALMKAAWMGHCKVVELLISNGAYVDACEKPGGETALMMAVKENHVDVVKALLNRGASAQVVNFAHETALDIALKKGLVEVAGIVFQNQNSGEKP